jgi:O-succinylbenzoate synthase
MTLHIEALDLYHIRMTLKHPFETSFGVQRVMDKTLTAVHSGGLTGWGESSLFHAPAYSYETIQTAWHIQHDFLLPRLLLGAHITHPAEVGRLFAPVRGHPMAKAGPEAAVWDLYAKQRGESLSAVLGGTRRRVPVGVSIGIQPSVDALVERVRGFVTEGYPRIKVKIKPGWDVEPVAALHAAFPDAALMADANSAYTLADRATFEALDAHHLLMIEQPLAYDDLLDHAALQAAISTPLCLDESIHSLHDARLMYELGSGRIINLKPTRVGGWAAAKHIHDFAHERGIGLWVGGMLESGVGRAHNLALAALPGVMLPGDISGTARYWHRDIITHTFALNPDGTMTVPDGPGIGVEVDRAYLDEVTVKQVRYDA